jgi:hypothetical protein
MRRSFLVGVGVGAMLMYFFDPSWGRRRRAQMRERIEVGARRLEEWRDEAEVRRRLEEEDEEETAEARAWAEEGEIDWMATSTRPVRRDE